MKSLTNGRKQTKRQFGGVLMHMWQANILRSPTGNCHVQSKHDKMTNRTGEQLCSSVFNGRRWPVLLRACLCIALHSATVISPRKFQENTCIFCYKSTKKTNMVTPPVSRKGFGRSVFQLTKKGQENVLPESCLFPGPSSQSCKQMQTAGSNLSTPQKPNPCS